MTARRGNGIAVTPLWMPNGRALRHLRWGTPDDCGAAIVTDGRVIVVRIGRSGDRVDPVAGALKTSMPFADLVRSREPMAGEMTPDDSALGDVLGLPWSGLVQNHLAQGDRMRGGLGDGHGTLPATGAAAERVGALVAACSAMVADAIGRDVVDFLARHRILKAGQVEFHAVGGDARKRRMQAVDLYPYLSTMLRSDPDMTALVDAGRPFEPLLAATL